MASRPYGMRVHMGSSGQRRQSEEPKQSPGSSVGVIEPYYALSQSSDEGPDYRVGQRTSSKMYGGSSIVPVNSFASGRNANDTNDRSRPVRYSLRNRTPARGPSRTRTMLCNANEEEMQDGYARSTHDRNKTNNNAGDRSCRHHANRDPGSVSMLIMRKPEKTLYDKIMSPTFAPTRRNANNANNKTTKRGKSKQRAERLRSHPDPVVNEARRIGAQLAMVGLSKDSAQLNNNLRVTGAMKDEWDDEPTTSGHGQVSFGMYPDADNGYNGNSEGRQGRSYGPVRGKAKNHRTPAKQANRSSNSRYNFRPDASKTPPFEADNGVDPDDDMIMDYNNSAEYQNEPIKYVSDLGPAQRINRRETSASRNMKLIQLEGGSHPPGTVVQKDVDRQIQTAYAMQTAVFITAACYALHLSCLGHLKEDVLTDRRTYDQVNRLVTVLQFLASYLYGRYGDMSGVYPALFVTYLTSAITYGLLAVAYEDNVIFASRILTVFMHNIEVGQMAICQTGGEHNRAVLFGKVALSHGLGMKLGGVFSETLIENFGAHDLSLIIAGVECACLLLIVVFTNFARRQEQPHFEEKTLRRMFSVPWLMELLASPRLLQLLMAQFCSSLAVYVFQGAFPIMGISYFHMSKDQLAFCLTYIAMFTLVAQSVGISLAITFAREQKLGYRLSLGIAVIYFLLMFVPSAVHVWLLVLPLSVAVTLLNLVLTSALTKCGPADSNGSIIGLNMMVVILAKAVAPILIKAVTSDSNFADVAILGLACSSLTCLLLYHENKFIVLSKTPAR